MLVSTLSHDHVEKKQARAYVDAQLWKRFQILAKENDIPVNVLTESALREKVAKMERATTKKQNPSGPASGSE